MIRKGFFILSFGVVSMFFSACIKKAFDNPPNLATVDPKLPVSLSLAQLRNIALTGQGRQITGDSTVCGIVTADDRSGNLYKQIIIEDSTGGMAILIDAYNLYNDYPAGRKVYIKLKGLYIGAYKGLPEVGYALYNGSISGIPSAISTNYVVKATYPNALPLTVMTMAQAASAGNTPMLNRLVRIDSVEFTSTDMGQVYAQPSTIVSGTSRNLEDCFNHTLTVYTSGYANFQPYLTATGKGSITGIYSTYNGTPQFIIRDTTDVKFYGARCGGSTTSPAALISVDSVRHTFTGSNVTLGSVKVKGVVISDLQGGDNLPSSKSIYIQDGNRGINIFFSTNASFAMGDSIVVDLTGGLLQSYNGTLEVSGIPSTNGIKYGTGTVVPRVVTISQISGANYSDYESTLVQIANATLSGGTTFAGTSGNLTLTDATGSMTLYTGKYATFATNPIPTTPKTFVGILTEFNTTKQLSIRNLSDIK